MHNRHRHLSTSFHKQETNKTCVVQRAEMKNMEKPLLKSHRLMSQIADRVMACVSVMKGLDLALYKRRGGANPYWETSNPGVSESYHLPLFSFISSFFFASLDCAQTHPLTSCHSALYKHTRKKNLIPILAFEPCLPSVAKWKLYCP